MRVIAGTARSLPLKTPSGPDTRPTTDRIKETLFNMLQGYLPDAVFVDMFSGSGGIGIEALSRGAKKAYFVENMSTAAACITENLHFTKFMDKGILLKQDCRMAPHSIYEQEVDIIFMDPPYGKDLEHQVLDVLKDKSYVTENTLIVVEADLSTDFSYLEEMGFVVKREKEYKTNKHIYIKKQA